MSFFYIYPRFISCGDGFYILAAMASETCFGPLAPTACALRLSEREPRNYPQGESKGKRLTSYHKTPNHLAVVRRRKKNNCIMADFDPEAAKRDAKKMTVPQLKDRLSAAAADTSGRKADLVARWVETAHALAVAKETNRITGDTTSTPRASATYRASPHRS